MKIQKVIKIVNMTHTACGGTMKNHKKGVRCTKCGYTLKHSEINQAYLNGKLDLKIPKGKCKEMKVQRI